MRKTRNFVIMLVIFVLISLAVIYPVVAEIPPEYSISYVRIPYGNGIDDNNDGVVDDWNETDVHFGNVTINQSISLCDDWANLFTWNDGYNFSMDKGVQIAGHYEVLWDIDSSLNGSVAPNINCYQTKIDYNSTRRLATYEQVANVLPVVTYYVNMSPKDIMNGFQECWYRSPLLFDKTYFEYDNHTFGDVPYHWVNIYRVSDNQLVYASCNVSFGVPPVRLVQDNSTNGTTGYRIYYRMDFPFQSDTRYRIEEFVKTIAGAPVNTIALYMVPSQDIGNDGEINSIIFKDTAYARIIPVECSWGMLCTWGIGKAGTENVILSSDGTGNAPTLHTDEKIGGTTSEVYSVKIVIPLRMTFVQDHIDVHIAIWEDGGSSVEYENINVNYATGTIICETNITDPDDGDGYNHYSVYVKFNDLCDPANANEGIAYSMYPSDGSIHWVFDNGCHGLYEAYNNFAVFCEIIENTTAPVPVTADMSQKDSNWLVGLGLLLAGIIIIAVAILAPVSLPIMIAGLTVGAITMAAGGDFILTGGQNVNAILGNLGTLARAFGGFISGVAQIIGGFIDAVVQIVQGIIHLGENILYYAGLVMEAVWQIIWFLAFLIVMWGVTKFLEILTATAELQFGKALSGVEDFYSGGTRAIGRFETGAGRVTKPIVRYKRGRERHINEQRRQEELNEAKIEAENRRYRR